MGAKDKNLRNAKGRTAKRRFAAGAAVLLILTALLAIRVLWPATSAKPQADPAAAEWMGRLGGGTLLSDINIPGTHDSGTGYVDLPFFCQCQAFDIKTQLELGYRFLDMRLTGDESGGLNICHGGFLCRTGPFPWSEPLGLERALEWCYSFLEEHPSETIIFLAKNESGDRSDEEIRDRLFSYIERKPGAWFLENRVPALEEARGKLVLANRMKNAEGGVTGGMAFLWEDQGNTDPVDIPAARERINESTVLVVQDRYCYNTADKKEAVLRTLESAGGREPGYESEDVEIFLNYLSTKGRLPVGHPLYYAGKLNPMLRERGLEQGRSYGWIIFDFGDRELARIVYESNF